MASTELRVSVRRAEGTSGSSRPRAVGAVRSGAASVGRIALNVVRLALAWLIGFPAAVMLGIAVVVLIVAVIPLVLIWDLIELLLPKRQQ